jgi:hypothetical protein
MMMRKQTMMFPRGEGKKSTPDFACSSKRPRPDYKKKSTKLASFEMPRPTIQVLSAALSIERPRYAETPPAQAFRNGIVPSAA